MTNTRTLYYQYCHILDTLAVNSSQGNMIKVREIGWVIFLISKNLLFSDLKESQVYVFATVYILILGLGVNFESSRMEATNDSQEVLNFVL